MVGAEPEVGRFLLFNDQSRDHTALGRLKTNFDDIKDMSTYSGLGLGTVSNDRLKCRCPRGGLVRWAPAPRLHVLYGFGVQSIRTSRMPTSSRTRSITDFSPILSISRVGSVDHSSVVLIPELRYF